MKRTLMITIAVGLASATACNGSSSPKITSASSPTVDVKAAEASAAAAAVASYKSAQATASRGAATTTAAPSSAVATSTAPAASTTPPSAASSAAASTDSGGPKTFKPGYIATVTDDTGTVLKVSLTLKGATSKATNDLSGKPKHGYFVTVLVKATALKKWDVNPFDFYAKDKDGQHYAYGDGNALFAGGDTDLHSATLSAGEKLQGTMTFDVPTAHPIIEYAPQEQALGGWQF